MGSKSFGIKQMGIVGSGNTSVLGSNADLKLNATGQVAITTNTTIAGVVTATAFVGDGSGLTNLPGGGGGSYSNSDVDTHLNTGSANSGEILSWNGSDYDWVSDQTAAEANLTLDTLDVAGIATAGSFVTDLIDGSGTSRGFCTRYYVTANGASAYRFAGPGQRNTQDNPSLYLMRGFTYMFENSTGSSHPFRIQFTGTSTGVGTYVSGDQNGVQIFTIPHDAPASYEYICTIHPGMKGNFIIPS